MSNLKEQAKNYVAKTFKTIDTIEKISVDVEIFEDGEGTNKDGSVFKYNYFKDGEAEIRMPKSVIGQLKVQLEANPKLTHFKVSKTGSGLGTEYTVIPLLE